MGKQSDTGFTWRAAEKSSSSRRAIAAAASLLHRALSHRFHRRPSLRFSLAAFSATMEQCALLRCITAWSRCESVCYGLASDQLIIWALAGFANLHFRPSMRYLSPSASSAQSK